MENTVLLNTTLIYLVENCYGDPNKVYIGKNKLGSKTRKGPHKRVYGKTIIYTVIDSVNSLLKKDWKPLESYWIEQFRQWGFEVVNKQKEGGGGVEFHTEETKQKMRKPKPEGFGEKLKGQKRSEETKELLRKINTRPKPKPEGYGEKISRTIKGLKRSEQSKQNISQGLKGRECTWGEKISKSGKNAHFKPINQYDLNGNFIKEWNSPKEANKFLRPNSKDATTISAAARGIQKTALGFKWKYKK